MSSITDSVKEGIIAVIEHWSFLVGLFGLGMFIYIGISKIIDGYKGARNFVRQQADEVSAARTAGLITRSELAAAVAEAMTLSIGPRLDALGTSIELSQAMIDGRINVLETRIDGIERIIERRKLRRD